MRALLTDFIKAYHHTNKGAKVRFVFAAEPFTDTMADLADFALTSGYDIGLVGHAGMEEDPAITPFWDAAEGSRQTLSEHTSLPQGIVSFIGAWQPIAAVRLILLSDPEEDDNSYVAVDLAMGKNIPVRTMLKGLDIVSVKPDSEDSTPDNDKEEQPDMARRDVEEEEYDDEVDVDDGDVEVDDDYYDSEAEEDDEGADEDGEDYDEEEGEDEEEPAPRRRKLAVVEDEDEEDLEESDEDDEEEEAEEADDELEDEDEEADDGEEGEDLEDDDVDEGEDDADDGDEEEEEDVAPAPKKKSRRSAPAPAADVPLTVNSLTRYAERDKEGFYELAAEYDVHPGRGMKISMMVERVLTAAGKPVKKAPAAAKAPAKRAAAPVKKAPAKSQVKAPAPQGPRSSASAAKKAPARTTSAPKAAAPKAPSSAVRKAAIKAMAALIDLLEEV
jgi:hypothetical protein